MTCTLRTLLDCNPLDFCGFVLGLGFAAAFSFIIGLVIVGIIGTIIG